MEQEERIIENGYALVDMLDELAEEVENFNADDEIDKRYIYANRKLADALRYYIKINYGNSVLYSDDDEYEPTTISDDTITGD